MVSHATFIGVQKICQKYALAFAMPRTRHDESQGSFLYHLSELLVFPGPLPCSPFLVATECEEP